MLNLERIKLELKGMLSEYRYEHSIRVADEAKKLAIHYGISEDDAYMAGLLHDIAKEYTYEKNKYFVDKYNLSSDLLNEDNSRICHAEIGALVAKELYGVTDDVCRAIRYHTVGNVNMNMLDKIVFVADKIESGKKYPGIDNERILAYKNIDDALIECLINNKKN